MPQNIAELVPNLLLQIPLHVDFLLLIPLFLIIILCFMGIFSGPLNTNCIKYQANQKWVKLELSLSFDQEGCSMYIRTKEYFNVLKY